MAAMLAVPPRNLADQTYMDTRSDHMLFDVIRQGGAAMGLSAAMTAFGQQLTEQQIWDTVAYIRTLAADRSAAAASQPAPVTPVTDLTMLRLRLSIWPEYDDPRVLVMLRGEMAPHQAFPASITLPLPKGAEIIGAGMISERNELLIHPYQVLPGNTQDSLQLNLPVARFFLEFYYNPFTTSTPDKQFTYTVPTTYPIELLEVDIQQPLKATNFTLEPPSMDRRTDNQGLTYYQFTYRDMQPGHTQTFTISYTKTVPTPSVPKQQPSGQPSGKVPPPASTTLLSQVILAGAILLFAGGVWLWRIAIPRPAPGPSAARTPTPTASDLLALLQEDVQAQETTVTMPQPPPTRVVNFCTHCGRKVLPDDRFCSGCGESIKR
jgi:hypothetical protein